MSLSGKAQAGSTQEEAVQEIFEDALGYSSRADNGLLGMPLAEDIICRRTKGWHRQPAHGELLVVNDTSDMVHALRPPQFFSAGMCLRQQWADALEGSPRPTWCKCTLSIRAVTTLAVVSAELLAAKTLCKRCFGQPTDTNASSESSSDSAE